MAIRLGVVYIKYNFNGVSMSIGQGCTVDNAVDMYRSVSSVGGNVCCNS